QLNREISQTSICLSSRKDFITGSWRRVTTKLPPHMDQDIPQMLVDMEKDEPLGMHNSFMQLKATKSQLIGGVNAIWMVQKPGNQSSYFFHTTLFQKLDENGFYRMREMQKTSHKAFVHT
ncbi:hypothetical protein PSHT_08356, partial [Puccinia striiformis]